MHVVRDGAHHGGKSMHNNMINKKGKGGPHADLDLENKDRPHSKSSHKGYETTKKRKP